jgi:hypothetical protein
LIEEKSGSLGFCGSVRRIDRFSFRRAAGDATFEFVSEPIDGRISVPRKISPNAHLADALDRFSVLSVQQSMIQLADQQFGASMAEFEDIHFVNVLVDSGTVHTLTLVHCVVLNPFLLPRPVLFDFRESAHFVKGNHASLSERSVIGLTQGGISTETQDPR